MTSSLADRTVRTETPPARSSPRGPSEHPYRKPYLAALALSAWVGLVWLTHVWGERLVHRDRPARIFAAPLAGRFDPRWSWWLLPAIALAALAVLAGPRVVRALPWRRLLWVAFAAAGAWAVALAASDGFHALTAPLTTRWDYLVDLPRVGNVHAFLSGFAAHAGTFSTHMRAHPPGMLLLLWSLDWIGLRGAGPEAAVIIAAGASMVPAGLIVVREMAGEAAARTAAPFLVFAPAALWVATSADALFAGVAAWGVALIVLATRHRDTRGDLMAAGGGLLLGAAAFLSYGLVLSWIVVAFAAAHLRRARPVAVAAASAVVLGLAVAAAGFLWTDGLAAAHAQYLHSAARARPQHYFWLGNLGAFALALGPAVFVAVAWLRNRGAWLLVASGLLIVGVADASGLSKGEVERIWLPFVPWILASTCALAFRRSVPNRSRSRLALGSASGLLAAQAATALALQSVVRSPW